MDIKEHILFITGKLAEKNLKKILDCIENKKFSYEIKNLNVNVAALLTTKMIERRIGDVSNFDKIIIPGKVKGDINVLSKTLNISIERGPEELKDLPVLFGGKPLKYDLSKYEVHIFAEITDAPLMTVDEIINSLDNNLIKEVFGAGTAATIAPIKTIGYKNKKYHIPQLSRDSISSTLLKSLNSIKYGETEDKFGWILKLN